MWPIHLNSQGSKERRLQVPAPWRRLWNTGPGRANCAGNGGRVAKRAEYRIQLLESATPSISRMLRQH